ncbi:MAG: CopG family transcriptional regulator [Methylococcales bacterium]
MQAIAIFQMMMYIQYIIESHVPVNMQRTQIYLTDEEQAAIRQISIRKGASQSALIRLAIDQYIAQNSPATHSGMRMKAFGIWQDHQIQPTLDELRAEERFTP